MSDVVKVKMGELEFTLNVGDDSESLFAKLAHLEEVFGHSKCLSCGSSNIKKVVRTAQGTDDKGKVKTYTYYELRCSDCYSKLQFGQGENGMFPQRKDKNGNYKPNGGWTKYNKETGEEE